MKLFKRIFVFTLLVAMIAGCSSNSSSEKKKAEKEVTVMLDWYQMRFIALSIRQLKKDTLKKKE